MLVGYQAYENDGSAWTWVKNMFSREDKRHGFGGYDSGVQYQAGAGVTTAVDIALGANGGAAGDRLRKVVVRLASASAPATVQIKDGSTVLQAYTRTLADNAFVEIDLGGLISVDGGWRINITCSGTMANCHYLASGTFA
jgi:hypothetical protein